MSKCTCVDVMWNCFYLITMHISVYCNKVENEILLFPCDVISDKKNVHRIQNDKSQTNLCNCIYLEYDF